MISRLKARWWKEQYEPTWLGAFINPFFIARRGLRNELLQLLPRLEGDVLDVGCGCKPYRHFAGAASYTGLDIDNEFTRKVGAADVFYDGKNFPLPDGRFNGVLCSQVLEHVFTPDDFLREVHRVMRPGGMLVLTVPFAWDEHEQPFDFARYSSFGLRALLERSGFEIVEQRKSIADARAIVQLGVAWLFKVLQTRNKWVNAALQVLVLAPMTIVGLVAAAVLPGHPDFYLDNVILARKAARGA